MPPFPGAVFIWTVVKQLGITLWAISASELSGSVLVDCVNLTQTETYLERGNLSWENVFVKTDCRQQDYGALSWLMIDVEGPIVGGATPGQVVLRALRKQTEQASIDHSSLVSQCIKTYISICYIHTLPYKETQLICKNGLIGVGIIIPLHIQSLCKSWWEGSVETYTPMCYLS